MPYFVYKVTQPTPIVKNLRFEKEFEEFKDAKAYTREVRAELPLNGGITLKMIHAANQLQAEELLMERREETVTMEWEK
jgi:phage/plasmid-associated DNA primase